jgi:hypothetical protein
MTYRAYPALIASVFGALPLTIGGCLPIWEAPGEQFGVGRRVWSAVATFPIGWGWTDPNTLTAAGLSAIGVVIGIAMYRTWGRTDRRDQAEDYGEMRN